MNLIIGILMIAAPAAFLYYWGKSGFGYEDNDDD